MASPSARLASPDGSTPAASNRSPKALRSGVAKAKWTILAVPVRSPSDGGRPPVGGHRYVEAVGPDVCGSAVGPADFEAKHLRVPRDAAVEVSDRQVHVLHAADDGSRGSVEGQILSHLGALPFLPLHAPYNFK